MAIGIESNPYIFHVSHAQYFDIKGARAKDIEFSIQERELLNKRELSNHNETVLVNNHADRKRKGLPEKDFLKEEMDLKYKKELAGLKAEKADIDLNLHLLRKNRVGLQKNISDYEAHKKEQEKKNKSEVAIQNHYKEQQEFIKTSYKEAMEAADKRAIEATNKKESEVLKKENKVKKGSISIYFRENEASKEIELFVYINTNKKGKFISSGRGRLIYNGNITPLTSNPDRREVLKKELKESLNRNSFAYTEYIVRNIEKVLT